MGQIAFWYKDVPIPRLREVWDNWESMHLHLSEDARIKVNRQWLKGDIALMVEGDINEWINV